MLLWFVAASTTGVWAAKKTGSKSLDEVTEVKEFKKLLKTRTSVLVCFTKSAQEASQISKLLVEVAEIVRGTGTIIRVDCGGYVACICCLPP